MPNQLFTVEPPEDVARLTAAIDSLAAQVTRDHPDDAAATVRVELLRLAAAKIGEVPGYKADSLLRTVREVLADLAPVAPPAATDDVAARLAAVPRSA